MRELCCLVGVLANRKSRKALLALVGYPLKIKAKNLAGGIELVKISKGVFSYCSSWREIRDQASDYECCSVGSCGTFGTTQPRGDT